MSKEKQIQKYESKSKKLIDELSKMPPMIIATAYLHAINYTLYGENVTEKWLTATEQAAILEKAYRKGYYDALHRRAKSEDQKEKDNCNTCIHYKSGNPYCESCFDLDKYERKDKERLGEEAINHLRTVKTTCIASGYDSAVEDACDVAIEALTAIDDIKQEIFNAIDNVPITLSRNDADNLLKMDIQDIIDKHLKKEQE